MNWCISRNEACFCTKSLTLLIILNWD